MKKYLFLLTLLPLCGCFAGVAFTGAEAVKTMAQDRTLGNRVDDNAIALKINDKYAQADFDGIFTGVTTRIVEGRVMLTGAVKTADNKEKAETLAWQVSGVKEIMNEIQVAPNGVAAYSTDIWLQKSVRTKLLVTKTIHSSNFEVDVVNSVVYIIGIAQNDTERRNVIEISRRLSGVREVVSHIILKDDPRRGSHTGETYAQ